MTPTRVLVLGAHPDDAEVSAGGLLWSHRSRGAILRLISVTDGRSGHQSMADDELIQCRREEARQAGVKIDAEYSTWDFPDGYLEASLDVRLKIIREIRQFGPDLILTHRTCDYHPDHRAVGQAVQDASYMVTVPKIAPETPALKQDPIVAYMPDTFTRPAPLRTDIVLDATPYLDRIIEMMACHRSQFFDWLPFNQGIHHSIPEKEQDRITWLKDWFLQHTQQRRSLFWPPNWGPAPPLVEAFEISEYAGKLSPARG